MNRKFIFAIPLLLLSTLAAWAQETGDETAPAAVRKEAPKKQYPTRTVRGKVLDAATRQPMAGALVRVAEIEGYSTLTADDGTYELTVPQFATSIEVSVPDYNLVKIGLRTGEEQQEARLHPDTFTPEYDAATSIAVSSAMSDFRFSNAVSIENEIQNRLGAVVHTTTRSGTPGIGSVMFIGGLNSLNANAQPLIVIDDVIFDQQYSRTTLHDGFYNDILSNISTADIESVEVLQNGTALYGAKGSNGVILIRTRRNHSMATRITASLSAGVVLEPKHFKMMDATQYRSYASDLLQSTHTTIKDFKFLNENPSYYYYPQYHNDTDWKDDIYRTAVTQNYNINVEGGDDVADYNLSLGYINHKSTLDYNAMNRINIRFNSDIRLTDRFDVRFDASFANQTRNLRNDGAPSNYTEGTPTSAAFLAYAKSPMLSPRTFASGQIRKGYIDVSDESYLDEALADYSNYNYKLANPLAINEYGDAENKNRFENSMVNLSVKPKFRFGRYVTLSEHFSYNLVNTNEKFYIPLNGVPSYYVSSVNAYVDNEVRSMAGKQNSLMSNTRLDFQKRFGAHDLHLFGGARINWETYTLSSQLGYNTTSDKMPSISSSLDHAQIFGNSDKWTNIAWYAQGSYNYLQRYYLQASLTAEASSRYGRDADGALKFCGVPWGIFPGVQAAWVISNEPWFQRLASTAAHPVAVNYLRLNVGYDVTGNDDIDYHAARSYFASHNFLEDVSGLTLENIGNTHLKWETTRRFTVSAEANFLDNRLNLRAGFFSAVTDDLLLYRPLHYVTGLQHNWANSGKMTNRGFDVSLRAKLLALKDWQWEVGATMGHYKNRISELGIGQTAIENEVYGATIRTQEGQAANLFYGYHAEGVFATSEEATQAALYILDDNGSDHHNFTAGDVHFADLNGDHRIDAADRTIIGDPNPDIYGNIFTSLNWRRLKLDINFNYSLGNDIYNYQRQQLESGSRFMNQTTAVNRRWQTEQQQTDMPRATFQDPMGNNRFSDRWIEDGSYLKLKTVTLSYTLPMRTQFLQGFQFWIQGNNLLTFSKYLGGDPESAMTGSVIGQGIDLGLLPLSPSFVAGVKINL
ncbi:MAG: SusC/RagA family TonB-linked outer membrane protein [Bacteroidaceae bacterium]|nr:SusC/RagA family TonB-linked outer membrane protein [Bacteroidaceae bacterium]